MGNMFNAHIFRRRSQGEREEVRMRVFNLDGTPAEFVTRTEVEDMIAEATGGGDGGGGGSTPLVAIDGHMPNGRLTAGTPINVTIVSTDPVVVSSVPDWRFKIYQLDVITPGDMTIANSGFPSNHSVRLVRSNNTVIQDQAGTIELVASAMPAGTYYVEVGVWENEGLPKTGQILLTTDAEIAT